MSVDAVVYFNVIDAEQALCSVDDFRSVQKNIFIRKERIGLKLSFFCTKICCMLYFLLWLRLSPTRAAAQSATWLTRSYNYIQILAPKLTVATDCKLLAFALYWLAVQLISDLDFNAGLCDDNCRCGHLLANLSCRQSHLCR